MVLEGVVTNVAAFGAFVDVGVHQDGLVHVSAMSRNFVSDPRQVVRSGDVVRVKVLGVDIARKRISLTLRLDDEAGSAGAQKPKGAPQPRDGKPRDGKPGDRKPGAGQPGAGQPGGGQPGGGQPGGGQPGGGQPGGGRGRGSDQGRGQRGGQSSDDSSMADALRRAGLIK
jgi:uncharacterized protein